MDKNRIKGSVKQATGAVKEKIGSILGDKKIEAEGNALKNEGKLQNAVGGIKDKAREVIEK